MWTLLVVTEWCCDKHTFNSIPFPPEVDFSVHIHLNIHY